MQGWKRIVGICAAALAASACSRINLERPPLIAQPPPLGAPTLDVAPPTPPTLVRDPTAPEARPTTPVEANALPPVPGARVAPPPPPRPQPRPRRRR